MYQVRKLQPKKMPRRRRKLRSLVPVEEAQQKPKHSWQLPLLMAFLLTGVIYAVFFSKINTSMVWRDFRTTYQNQYNLIVRDGKEYCKPTVDTGELFAQISKQVLNQRAAMSTIELQFRNDSGFISIAVVGTSGVGKTLFAQELNRNFPWQFNVHTYSWSMQYTVNRKKENVLTFLKDLSVCGRNLIIIDNLRSDDVDFVQEYNTQSVKYVAQTKVNLIVVYIFNVITYTDEQRERYGENIEALHQLKDVKVVEFREFGSRDLEDCVRYEAKNLNLTLDDDDYKEVLRSIDVERSGCKNVYSKVLMYGKVGDV